MVNSRTYIVPGTRTTYKHLASRFYGANEPKSRPLTLITRCDGDLRYPLVESVLGDMTIQPYVHNCSVTVLHRGRESSYTVFYRLHRRLPINRSVALLTHNHSVRRDIVVMRTDRAGRVTSMRHGDAVVADRIVER
ncbi:hypothetical protein C8Q79DRAFT_919327 [Trametes meyenii]|nr:hypothetical protein C8Q79DRAFT_919327 [Trametes meyenii]